MYAYLSNGLQSTVWFQFVDTMTLGLAISATLGYGTFAATTTHTDSVDDKALLGLESQTASLIGTSGSGRTMQFCQLTVLPDADAKQVTHNITLLLPVQFLHITVGTHVEDRPSNTNSINVICS